MRYAGFLSFVIFAGFAAGISLGYIIYQYEISYGIFPYTTPGSTARQTISREFSSLNIRGTIVAIDISKKTFLLNAISPYESGEHILLSLTFDAATWIGPSDVPEQLGSLSVGTPVSVVINRTSGALYAQRIRFGVGAL